MLMVIRKQRRGPAQSTAHTNHSALRGQRPRHLCTVQFHVDLDFWQHRFRQIHIPLMMFYTCLTI